MKKSGKIITGVLCAAAIMAVIAAGIMLGRNNDTHNNNNTDIKTDEEPVVNVDINEKEEPVVNGDSNEDEEPVVSSDLDDEEPVTCDDDNDIDVDKKPVIYLYGYDSDVKVDLEFSKDMELTCTYPKYNNGWEVTASPDGHLTDKEGRTYRYLYWEGKSKKQSDFAKGFCVKGSDTAAFLEDKLKTLGLNDDEAGEFIIYWLPQMEQNPYNVISFDTTEYEQMAKLNVNPTPDKMVRVYMRWYSSDEYVDITEPKLDAVSSDRNGKVVIEWGGTKIEK